MRDWFKLAAPAAMIVSGDMPAYAVQYLTVADAQKLCFPSATDFVAAHLKFKPSELEAIERRTGQKGLARAQQVWKARAGEKLEGYFIVDYVVGKHLLIDYAVALDTQGTVKQIEILEYRESYGAEIRSPSWRKQFAGRNTKSALSLNDDILNISGATLSCRHVTEGVKKILAIYETCLK